MTTHHPTDAKRLFSISGMKRTADDMVINHPYRLKKRIGRDRPDKFKAALFQFLAELYGQLRLGGNLPV